MNTYNYDDCKVFGRVEDFCLPEHIPADALDSHVIGLWCIGRGETPQECSWITYYHMVAVTETGRALVFTWPLLNNYFISRGSVEEFVADLFGSD